MVRVNLIPVRKLADQHLIAEYREIMMLVGSVKKHPPKEKDKIPREYNLGKGHINFFKNKLGYLKKRFEAIKKEMKRRGFKPGKSLSLAGCNKSLIKDWRPKPEDIKKIKSRLRARIRLKSSFYSYYRKKRPLKFYEKLLR